MGKSPAAGPEPELHAGHGDPNDNPSPDRLLSSRHPASGADLRESDDADDDRHHGGQYENRREEERLGQWALGRRARLGGNDRASEGVNRRHQSFIGTTRSSVDRVGAVAANAERDSHGEVA